METTGTVFVKGVDIGGHASVAPLGAAGRLDYRAEGAGTPGGRMGGDAAGMVGPIGNADPGASAPGLPAQASALHGGEAALVRLGWSAPQPVDRRYKISVQLLDGRGQVIAQHDGEPAGGSRPTDTWQAGEQITDNHAVPIAFGTPPGDYRLSLVVYDADTGARVQQAGGEVLPLGAVRLERADGPVPLDVIPMQHRSDTALGPVTLAGYDLYRQGYRHAPETPLAPGDLLHVTLYWLAPDPLPAEWPADQSFSLRLGDQVLTAPLAGGAYPTGQWAPGELVRGDFDVLYAGGDRRPVLAVGDDEMPLDVLPVR